jgi:DNA-binding XRE family transcriptional regulator
VLVTLLTSNRTFRAIRYSRRQATWNLDNLRRPWVRIINCVAQKIKARSLCLISVRSVNRSTPLKALRSPAAQAVATTIATAREKAGMTQRELASRLERPHSVIGMIESNQRQVNVPEFIAIAEAIGTDPGILFKRVLRERGTR